jgi:integrase
MPEPKIQTWVSRAKKRGKRGYVVCYRDPGTGRQRQKGGMFRRKRDAERYATRLEDELNSARDNVTWLTVKSRFQSEVLDDLKPSGAGKWHSATGRLDTFAGPRRLMDLNGDLMSRFGAHLRNLNLATATVKGYLAEIHRTLTWAATVWQTYTPPRIRMPKVRRARRGKGRPITGEEFERMLDEVAGVIGDEYAPEWTRTLNGFWLSGLRLSDVDALRWHEGPLAVQNIDTDRPRLYVAPGADKGGREESLPMHHFPDLVDFLRETPLERRRGHVFRPMLKRGRVSYYTLSDRIRAIGKAAGVVVVRNGEKVKFASAHDLRRSWATRWAPKVPRELLRRWMRHRSYQTTDQYYVDVDLDTLDQPQIGVRDA